MVELYNFYKKSLCTKGEKVGIRWPGESPAFWVRRSPDGRGGTSFLGFSRPQAENKRTPKLKEPARLCISLAAQPRFHSTWCRTHNIESNMAELRICSITKKVWSSLQNYTVWTVMLPRLGNWRTSSQRTTILAISINTFCSIIESCPL